MFVGGMMTKKLSSDQFRERLFGIIAKKHHWATDHFESNRATKAQLNIHFRQEYVVYVRDLAVLLARIAGKNPPWQIRKHLASTIYEEETGGLSMGQPHRELFLQMMMGLGFDRAEFRDVELLSRSRMYREWLDSTCQEDDWAIGAANLIICVEGTANDQEHVLRPPVRKTDAEIEDVVMKHPLVQYHGLSPECMNLVRVRETIDPGSRKEIYDMIVNHVVEADQQQAVLKSLEQGVALWLQYRDGIARACGLRAS